MTIRKLKTIGLILCLFLTSCSRDKGINTSQDLSETTNNNPNEIINISKNIDEKGITDDTPVVQLKSGSKYEVLEIIGEDNEYYGNLPQNMNGEYNEILLCKDPIYNIVYYVNYGEDYFIYSLKDGQVQLAVEIPAKALFTIGGNLYFMVESYEKYALKDLENGYILEYNPLSGEVSVIVKDNASRMFVYSDGIYYRKDQLDEDLGNGISTRNVETYYYAFDSHEVESIEDNYMTLYRWREYFVSYIMEEVEPDESLKQVGITDKILQAVSLKLETLDKVKTISLDNIPFMTSFQIVEDKLYHLENYINLLIYNIDASPSTNILLALPAGNNFIVFDDVIYTDNFLRIDRLKGNQSLVTMESGKRVREFYTDGENLYGIIENMGGSDSGVMRKLQIIKTENELRIDERDNGVKLELDQFVCLILPMGKE